MFYADTYMYAILTELSVSLYFLSICSIADNKSLHLEHTAPETKLQQPLSGSSLHANIPVAVKCHDYHLRQCRAERSCAEMMASNGWVAVKKWVTFAENIQLSVKVIFTQRFSKSEMTFMVFVPLLIAQLEWVVDWIHTQVDSFLDWCDNFL